MEKKEGITASFRIIEVNLNSFQEFKPEIKIPENYNNYTYEIQVSSKVNKELRLIIISVLVKIFLDNEKKITLASIETSSIFEITNLNEIVKFEDEKLKIPEFLMATLIGISISTIRGMLLAKTSGSIIQNAIIPVINPSDFLKTNTEFSLENDKKMETVE